MVGVPALDLYRSGKSGLMTSPLSLRSRRNPPKGHAAISTTAAAKTADIPTRINVT
jgi:hypothetical protein